MATALNRVILAYYFFHFWLLLIPAFMFYGAYEKRREFKRALL
jgi:hypothetical protein